MKIYLAGSCSSEKRTMMVEIANLLRAEGYKVLCPFEYKVENEWKLSQETWAKYVFDHDCRLIEEADLVLVISPGRNSTAGTNWEQGFAYGLNKLVCVAQFGVEPTSLMTYWGCDSFVNIEGAELSKIVDMVKEIEFGRYKKICNSVLT